eukprot:1986409-Alexandrium_andersonii.AAC.1
MRLLARPEVSSGVGHMRPFGMRTGPPDGGAGRLLVRQPTRWTSFAPEVLKRTCLRCANEGGTGADCWRQR